MYKFKRQSDKRLSGRPTYQGETIEAKVRRIVENKEPITDGAPMHFTERKDGVRPEFNVKTDRWEVATEKMDYVNRSKIAKREERNKIGDQAKEGMEKETKSENTNKDTGGESIQATDTK